MLSYRTGLVVATNDDPPVLFHADVDTCARSELLQECLDRPNDNALPVPFGKDTVGPWCAESPAKDLPISTLLDVIRVRMSSASSPANADVDPYFLFFDVPRTAHHMPAPSNPQAFCSLRTFCVHPSHRGCGTRTWAPRVNCS